MINKKIIFVLCIFFLSINSLSAKFHAWNLTNIDNLKIYSINTDYYTLYHFDTTNNDNNNYIVPKDEGIWTYLAAQDEPYNRFTDVKVYNWSLYITKQSNWTYTCYLASQATSWAQYTAYPTSYRFDNYNSIITNNINNSSVFLGNPWNVSGWNLYRATDIRGNTIWSKNNLTLSTYQLWTRYTIHAKLYNFDKLKPRWNWIQCKVWARSFTTQDNITTSECNVASNWYSPYTLWNWTNWCIRCRVECVDTWVTGINVSWCAAEWLINTDNFENLTWTNLAKWNIDWAYVYTKYSWYLWHKSIPTVPIDDNTNQWASISWANDYVQDILIDYASPNFKVIEVDDIPQTIIANDYSDIALLPWTHKLYFEFWDKWDWNVWVSWIKEYSYSFTQIEDHLWNTINNVLITDSETKVTYWVYNPNWNITAEDIKQITIPDFEVKSIWRFKLTFRWIDHTWNSSVINKYFNVIPWEPCVSWNTLTRIDLLNSNNWELYADNSDFYEYKLSLRDCNWNPIYRKSIESFEFNIDWVTDWKTIYLDSINQTNNYNLNIEWDQITDDNWNAILKVKSVAPWIFTERFKVVIKKYDDNYVNIPSEYFAPMYLSNASSTIENTFKKPFNSELLISNDWWLDWGSKPSLNDLQYYKVDLISPNWSFPLNDWHVNISQSTILLDHADHVWDWSFLNPVYEFSDSSTEVKFRATINSIWDALTTPIVKTNWLIVDYLINDKRVKYSLTNWNNYNDNVEVSIWNWDTLDSLWLKIIWNLQWDWDTTRSWLDNNFSLITKADLRKNIRENAYTLIKWMESWEIVNWVQYIEWDYTLSSVNNKVETIIIKDWNLLISTLRLNESDKKLWIIVLNDWYSVHDWYNKEWNVYIDKQVRYIWASIFADWAIISTNWFDVYNLDDFDRTSALSRQLVIHWSIFTRNTIWGTLLKDWKYSLPWWELVDGTIENKKTAFIYDLNNLRTSNDWWDWIDTDEDWNEYNFGMPDNVIIKYNPTIQTDPPKWFNN